MDGYMSDPDIFADEDSQPVQECLSPKTPVKQESAEMSRLRLMMGGIPPPPEKTNPQMDVMCILDSWKQNTQYHWKGSENCVTEEDVKKRFDVYLNKNIEDEEVLRLKVAERLVSSETSSSFMRHELLTNSAKKRQRRNGWAKSPGSRLSYLAKRRTTFSQRPNLSQSRTISIIRDDRKGKEKKAVTLKRALFQSPDKADFSTPDTRIKRLKLCVESPKPANASRMSLDSKLRSCSRNLETEFEKLRSENFNQRQKQLWCRTPLSALSTQRTIL